MRSTHNAFSSIDLRSPLDTLLAFMFSGASAKAETIQSARKSTNEQFFELIEHTGKNRSTAEQFISQRFFESFGSRVESFMPRLFTLRTKDGEICGAFGLRSANRQLFLEQYLDIPIEKAVMARTAGKVNRQDIVEVGHFSGTFPGAVRAMICLLTEHLHREGFKWVTFTGTASLRNAFSRMGLAPLDIKVADADRLPADERANWGSYYEHAPHVLVGNINQGYRSLVERAARPTERFGRAA